MSALRHLSTGCDFVLLIDDLEGDRRDQADAVFRRYRAAFDAVLPAPLRCRASGHFLVNILEAYYLADASALNAVLKTDWSDHVGDVEEIRHPKNDLKNRFPGFDVIEHGEQILDQLDVPLVLDNPDTCSALRTLFGWCWRALGLAPTDEYQLLKGRYSDLTRAQLEQLPPVEEA